MGTGTICNPRSSETLRGSRGRVAFLAATVMVLIVTSLALAGAASAATKNWTGRGSGGTKYWSDPNNWSPASVPSSTDDLIFGDQASVTSGVDDISGVTTVNSIDFAGSNDATWSLTASAGCSVEVDGVQPDNYPYACLQVSGTHAGAVSWGIPIAFAVDTGPGPTIANQGLASGSNLSPLTFTSAATIDNMGNTLYVGGSSALTTLMGAISGTGGLTTVAGANQVTLGPNNSYGGTTTLNSPSTLFLTSNGSIKNYANKWNVVALNGSTLEVVADGSAWNETQIRSLYNAVKWPTVAGQKAILDFYVNSGEFIYSNAITTTTSSPGNQSSVKVGLTKDGAGTLQLQNAANLYVGPTKVTAGTLDFEKQAQWSQATSSFSVANGGTVSCDIHNGEGSYWTGAQIDYFATKVNWSNGSYLEIDSDNAGVSGATFDGGLNGLEGFAVTGGQPVSLGGSNLYQGPTDIRGGAVTLTSSGALPAYTNLTMFSGTNASLNLGGNSYTIGYLSQNLSPGGNIALGSGTLTSSFPSGYYTYGGVMSGAGSFVKAGTGGIYGEEILTGANTYLGTTTVSGGVLYVNGSTSASSAATVASGATLAGNGAVQGTVAVNGIISPGDFSATKPVTTIATLNTGTETWNGGGRYNVDVNRPPSGGTAGSNWDLLNISGGTGRLDIASSSSNKFTVGFDGTAVGFDKRVSQRWPIATTSGGVTGFDTSVMTLASSGFETKNPLASGWKLFLGVDGNTLYVIYAKDPTNVTVGAFSARVRGGQVVTSWKTSSLGDTVGFQLYRKSLKTGKYVKVTPSLVPADFGKPGGAIYSFVDKKAPLGHRLTYRLKELRRGGEAHWYGPYKVRPTSHAGSIEGLPFQ